MVTIMRECPICKKFVEEHPDLNVGKVLMQKKGSQGWYHTSANGRKLHEKALAEAKEPTGPKYPELFVQLTGEDGNAMAIVSRTRRVLRRGHVATEEVSEFSREALSGDYDHVLQTVIAWVDTG